MKTFRNVFVKILVVICGEICLISVQLYRLDISAQTSGAGLQ